MTASDQLQICVVASLEDVSDLKAVITLLEQTPGALGVDTETTGLDPHCNRVRLISVAAGDLALVVDLDPFRTAGSRSVAWELEGAAELRRLLESARPKVLQNAAFDLNFLRGEGVILGGFIFDTMIASKIIHNGNSSKNDLGAIVRRELGFELTKELQKANWAGPVSEDMFRYSAKDAWCLPKLIKPLTETLRKSRVGEVSLHEVFKLESSCLRAIASMQWHGFAFDTTAALEVQAALEAKSEGLKLEFLDLLDTQLQLKYPSEPSKWLPREPDGGYNTRATETGSIRLGTKKYPGFNPRSPQQVTQKLTDVGIILPPNEKGKPSMDQNLLAFIRNQYPLVDSYMRWKDSATLVSHILKLVESVGPDGRIHACYRQMGTDTGRLSCAEPNLQQVPKDQEFRSLFVAEDGNTLIVADFSQIELRVAAELSGEPRMLEAYAAGRDLHTETAALMARVPLEAVTKSQRTSAKVCNFGLLYGAGPSTLRKQSVAQYGIDIDIKEAKRLVAGFREAYPRLYQWQTEEGEGTTKAVFTRYGRRRFLVGFNDKFTTRINTQVQGTAGDIAKLSIAMLWPELERAGTEARLIAMVHDEVVLEVRESVVETWSSRLKAAMESAGALVCQSVPIVAEVAHGQTWAEAK